MAKLYFYYSAMNAGKSTLLLQSAYNYKERGMSTLLFTPAIDDRYQAGKIYSRIGLDADAVSFDDDLDLFTYTKTKKERETTLACVLVDEAQFLNKKQVAELTEIVDTLQLPVLTFGIRNDFRAQPFEGSLYLLIWADHLIEIKTICHCGKKAIMNVRLDEKGNVEKSGSQIKIGGNKTYIAMCRRHFKEAMGKKHILD